MIKEGDVVEGNNNGGLTIEQKNIHLRSADGKLHACELCAKYKNAVVQFYNPNSRTWNTVCKECVEGLSAKFN